MDSYIYNAVVKTGLIIQGPILSRGYGPNEFHSDGSYKKTWIDYDSRGNVEQIIGIASGFFDVIIIVAWKKQGYTDFLDSVRVAGKIEVLELEENDFLISQMKVGTSKYHQIFTTYNGATKLHDFKCDVIAKIRTDHNMDIQLLHSEVLSHIKRNPRSIGVPNLNIYQLDRLPDFYIVGYTNLIIELCDEYMTSPEIFSDTHKDFFYKFASILSGQQNLNSEANNRWEKFEKFMRITAVWSEVFYPLDKKLFWTYFWRGRRVNHHLNQWIRWFFLLHSKTSLGRVIKVPANALIIFSIRGLKKPFNRFTSGIVYRKYRRLAQKGIFYS
jgi:hypothetical protein